jgi:4-hydroxymandelate oxidase
MADARHTDDLVAPAVDLARLEQLATERLEPARASYVGLGAGDTAHANVWAWQQQRLRPHVLHDVRTVSTSTLLLGENSPVPILIAPTAMHRLACDDGELATARAAARAGVTYVVSAMATTSIEDLAAVAPHGPRWMQAYMHRDRGRTRAMLERAAASGSTAVVLTVDSPGVPHVPEGQRRPLNEGLRLPNWCPDDPAPDVLAMASEYATDLTFAGLREVRSWTGLPLVLKGVLRGDDAARCLDEGADAIVVSNHGGRQIPGCIPTAVALEDVVAAVGGRGDVYVDGGIRSGADVLKALALGATAVMIGRSVWWGLALRGEAGVLGVLEAFRAELVRTMTLCGVTDVRCVDRDLVQTVSAQQSPPSSGEVPWSSV